MKKFLRQFLVLLVLMSSGCAIAAAQVTFGFKRTFTADADDATKGTVGDAQLQNSSTALSLKWIEKHNGSIGVLNGQKTFTKDNVAFTTSGSTTTMDNGGSQDLQFQMSGTFSLQADDNYFGYELALKEGYTLTLTHVDVEYWRTNKGLGYDVGVVDMDNTADTIRLGSAAERKVMNVELHKDISDVVLQGGKTYRLVLRHYGWYSGGRAEHYPLTFLFTGILEGGATGAELTSLTVNGNDILTKLTGTNYDYTMGDYGTTTVPNVEAISNDKGSVEITQATADNMTATVTLKGKDDGTTVATYTIHMKPSLPTVTATYAISADKCTWNADKEVFLWNDNNDFSVVNTGSYHENFKIGNGGKYTITVPKDVAIGQVKVIGDQAKYQKVSGLDTCLIEVGSKSHTMLVTNHQAGDPIQMVNDLWGSSWVTFELSTMDFKQVAKPSITLDALDNGAHVTISCETPNAVIYYTTDGTAPSMSSTLYTAPFDKTSNGTIRAIAVAPQFYLKNSDVAEATISDSKLKEGELFTFLPADYTLTSNNDYKYVRRAASNKAFAMASQESMYSDGRFKFGTNEVAILVPANAQVDSIKFTGLGELYGGTITWDYITSGDATVGYNKSIANGADALITFKGHKAGTPVLFQMAGGNPAFTSVVVYYAAYNDGIVNYTGSDDANKEKTLSGCVTLDFDRTVTLSDNAKATVDGNNAERTMATSASVDVYYWDLTENSTHTVTLPAGSVKDEWGNTYDKDITVTFTTGAKAADVADFQYNNVVGTADELKTAITTANETNKTADSPRYRIFIKNGEYEMSGETTITGYNISLIGQSREGVRIFHKGNGGIKGDATIADNGTNTYMQDFTVEHTGSGVRNGNNRGVCVAFAGGNKSILKNVEMISGQDTYLTGARSYLEDCTIHGSVDFICGGGAIYFNHTNLLVEGDGVLTAASHSSSEIAGYVFNDCTVKSGTFMTAGDGSYSLGRPWKNEPRVAFINTTMDILPAETGWAGMSQCVTHFYEYGSKDKDGNALDLSKRTVKAISVNQYTPVLTTDQLTDYTEHNTVGGKDGWEPSKLTTTIAAPTVTLNGNTISWTAVDGAKNYVVFKDGEYVGQTNNTTMTVSECGSYTVCAANGMGGLGSASSKVDYAAVVATVTIKDGLQRTSFSSTKAVDFSKTDGLTAYIVTKEDGTVEEVTNVPANTGVIVEGKAGTYNLYAGTDDALNATNLLVAATEEYTVLSGEKVYGYGKKDGNEGFWRYAEGCKVSAGKAYLRLTPLTTTKAFIPFGGTVTGINGVNVDYNDIAPAYNIAGQRVGSDYHGIIIKNGKKIIVK